MPFTIPSRRSLLAGAAGAATGVLITGCSGESGAERAERRAVSLERRMRETAVRESTGLLARYDATAAAHPALAGRLAPLRAAVAAHVAALAPRGATAPPSTAPSVPAGATGAAAPPAATAPVPAAPQEALAALAGAERSLAEARGTALGQAPGELARLLASVAACGSVHAYLLTAKGTADSPGAPGKAAKAGGGAGPSDPRARAAALAAAQAALAAEHAAVYGYGVVGARAADDRGAEARQAFAEHHARRDALTRTVRELGGAPRPSEAAYALPAPVRTAADAERLAAVIEDRVAGAYADLVRAGQGPLRRTAADALTGAAVRAARWHGVGVAFPGLAERSERADKS